MLKPLLQNQKSKLVLFLAFAFWNLISCTSGTPNYQGSNNNKNGVIIENASSDGDVWFGTETPGLSNIQLVILKNGSDGTADIHMDSLTLSQNSNSNGNKLSSYPVSPWGDSSTLCGDHILQSGETCYILIRFTASDVPTHDYEDSQFSIKASVINANGSNFENIITANLKTRSSHFGSGNDGTFKVSGGTINPLETPLPYNSQKMLFVYDEARVITSTTGSAGESLSRVKSFSADHFSVDDEVMFYVASAHQSSICAKKNLIGKYHFAKITHIDGSTNSLDVTPPLDAAWSPVNIDDNSGVGTPSYLPDGTENTFCNIQIIRVPNFYDFEMTDSTLVVPQYINTIGKQQKYESKILGNTNNRTGGVLPFRVKGKLTLKNSLINAVGSGFNGGRKFEPGETPDDKQNTPYGLGGSIFGWTSLWDSTTLLDIIFPSRHTGGDASVIPSAGSHLGQGGNMDSVSPDYSYYAHSSFNLPNVFSQDISGFNIATNQKFFLGSGGGYSNSSEFKNPNIDGIYDGGGFNGGGAVIIFANELESTSSRIDASGDRNVKPDDNAYYLYGEFDKTAPNFTIANSTVAAVLALPTTTGSYVLTGGTANLKPLSDLPAQDFYYTNLYASYFQVTQASYIIKFYLNPGQYFFDDITRNIPFLNLIGDASLSHTEINITNATMISGSETIKPWHYRASGAGGSIWLTAGEIVNADLDLIAEGGGSKINASRKDDNAPEVVHYGGGGGNIHITMCGSTSSSSGIPRSSSAGGRSDHIKANLNPAEFTEAQGVQDMSNPRNTYWGSAGLVSYLFGHKECHTPEEQAIFVKEIKPFAITYRNIDTSTGTLLPPTSILFSDVGTNTINVGMGCKKGENQNAYIEFRVSDTDLENAKIINVALSLPAVGQTKWNDKYFSDTKHSDKKEKMVFADSLKIRALKTFQSAYSSELNLRSNQLLSQPVFTDASDSPYFTFDTLKWVNDNYFDSEFNIKVLRLIWPKDGPIIEPNLLSLIQKIEPYAAGGIYSPFQMGANLGFGIGRAPYGLNNGTDDVFLGCNHLYPDFSSSTANAVYFKVTSENYPKLVIQYSK